MLAWYRDPQLVQQDEPDHDPGIEENHFADYDTSGDIPGTAIDDPPLPHPNDSGVLASLHVDERVLTENLYGQNRNRGALKDQYEPGIKENGGSDVEIMSEY
ncbi:hypothetical protein EV424DRAFT_1350214 [Suillus variegatus]|nr:hypothetical protein EV424DRAFT_1350214 [Suillus variegatus]